MEGDRVGIVIEWGKGCSSFVPVWKMAALVEQIYQSVESPKSIACFFVSLRRAVD